MTGPIHRFLSEDHRRLERLLQRALADLNRIDPTSYAEFRAGLLRHIAMEEKVLLPAAQQRRGGEALPLAARLRLDHGSLAALLVPSPTAKIVAALREIFAAHNAVEEGALGLYETCDQIAGAEAEGWVARLKAVPEVSVAAHNDGPLVVPAIRRALARAGYDFELEG